MDILHQLHVDEMLSHGCWEAGATYCGKITVFEDWEFKAGNKISQLCWSNPCLCREVWWWWWWETTPLKWISLTFWCRWVKVFAENVTTTITDMLLHRGWASSLRWNPRQEQQQEFYYLREKVQRNRFVLSHEWWWFILKLLYDVQKRASYEGNKSYKLGRNF